MSGKKERTGAMKGAQGTEDAAAKAGGIAADQLRGYVDRIERLTEEKSGIADGIKLVFAEAKSAGFDMKCLRQLIRERKWDQGDLFHHMDIMDLYRRALGMDGPGPAADGETRH